MKRIDKYEGLYGDREAKPDAGYIFSELLGTRSWKFDWNIEPHIHPAIYQLFFFEEGNLTFFEADDQRQLETPCMLLIPPMALHGFRYETVAGGRILTLSNVMLETLFPESALLTPMLTTIRCFTDFNGPYTAGDILALIKEVDKELFADLPEKKMMLRVCLQKLFLALYRLWQDQQVVNTLADNHSLGYFRKFQQRIREEGLRYTITQFAAELGITTVHLNRICREVIGKSAGQLVQDHVLEEAKKYLTYTSYTVSEIAYLLNFEYPNYFARFFRKHVGKSPKEFKNELRNKS